MQQTPHHPQSAEVIRINVDFRGEVAQYISKTAAETDRSRAYVLRKLAEVGLAALQQQEAQ